MEAEPKLGGWSHMTPATSQIDEICQKVKSEFEHNVGSKPAEFFPFAFRERRLIGGSKFMIKVYTGSRQCYVLTVQMQLVSGGEQVYKLDSVKQGHLFDDLQTEG